MILHSKVEGKEYISAQMHQSHEGQTKKRRTSQPSAVANASLQLLDVPVTDVSIVISKWVDYEPVQTGTNPI